jgi:uncharacterized protein YbaP (TraB family)
MQLCAETVGCVAAGESAPVTDVCCAAMAYQVAKLGDAGVYLAGSVSVGYVQQVQELRAGGVGADVG